MRPDTIRDLERRILDLEARAPADPEHRRLWWLALATMPCSDEECAIYRAKAAEAAAFPEPGDLPGFGIAQEAQPQ